MALWNHKVYFTHGTTTQVFFTYLKRLCIYFKKCFSLFKKALFHWKTHFLNYHPTFYSHFSKNWSHFLKKVFSTEEKFISQKKRLSQDEEKVFSEKKLFYFLEYVLVKEKKRNAFLPTHQTYSLFCILSKFFSVSWARSFAGLCEGHDNQFLKLQLSLIG